jgi:hypothetical protein
LPFASVYCNASLPVAVVNEDFHGKPESVVLNDFYSKTWAFEGAEQLLTQLAVMLYLP